MPLTLESDGSEGVRGARKALVKAVEAELDRVEGLKMEAWDVKKAVEESVEEVATVTAAASADGRLRPAYSLFLRG